MRLCAEGANERASEREREREREGKEKERERERAMNIILKNTYLYFLHNSAVHCPDQ